MSSRTAILALGAATLLLAACGEEKVAVYRVPKEKDPELPGQASAAPGAAADAPQPPAMADTAVPTASDGGLLWTAPASWKAEAAGPMRKATFSVPGAGAQAELSVTAFPGDVGGELANVNRWRGQVGLAPLSQGDLDAAVTRVEANGLKVAIVELVPAGTGDAILGAIVPSGGSTWFFKLKGPVPVLRAAKPEFVQFLHSVRAP
jgi:hypothetical protein